MEASELRIGNLLNFDDLNGYISIEKIISICKEYEVYWCETENFEGELLSAFQPIPLTEEWLIKFGGQKDRNKDIYISVNKDNDLRIYLSKVGILICKDYFCPLFGYPHIIHVHQLQNLFYAITGEELKTVSQ